MDMREKENIWTQEEKKETLSGSLKNGLMGLGGHAIFIAADNGEEVETLSGS